MKDKNEASKLVMNFCMMVRTQFSVNIKVLRSDNGSEFTSGHTKEFYAKHRMVHQTSYVDTHQQQVEWKGNINIF